MNAELVVRSFRRCLPPGLALLSVISLTNPAIAQQPVEVKHKPQPTRVDKQFLIVPDSVVTEQWAHTLNLVNPPEGLTLANPGQCIRIAILATGDDRDELLSKSRLSFRIHCADKIQEFPASDLVQIKRIKPEGADFVTSVAKAGDVQVPDLSMASLGVAVSSWCVPKDAEDGAAEIEADVTTPHGTQKLDQTKLQLEGFETGSKKAFNDIKAFGDFEMNYYRHPEPARMYAALMYFAADKNALSHRGTAESTIASIGSALRQNPSAAADFQMRIEGQKGFVRTFGLLALRFGGYDITPTLEMFNPDERQHFEKLPAIPDPWNFQPEGQNATRLDMLWGIYMATGELAPIRKIASALEWHTDWDEFQKMIKTPDHPKEYTPMVDRAVTYAAAGWSLGSFQRNDPLAADYIEFMLASADVSAAIKSELAGLDSNPAFRQTK